MAFNCARREKGRYEVKNRARMTSEEQRAFAEIVDCPFKGCMAKVGQPCVPGLIFPQYPHTPRLELAYASTTPEEKLERAE
jgi:hypothetical protein